MKKTLNLTLGVFICVLFSTTAFTQTYYVSASARGSNNGSSWASAYISLATALQKAGSGDTIKVAAGTYSADFTLSRGITMLGGYPATGNPTDGQRDWIHQQTLLIPEPSQGDYTIITAVNIDTATTIDGVYIENGGGITVSDCSNLTIRNTIFQGNQEGALSASNSHVLMQNCVVNTSHGLSFSNQTFAQVYNCVFTNNGGGALVSQDANVQIANCSIVNNGGIPYVGNGGGTATIVNTIFWNNIGDISALYPTTLDTTDITFGGQAITLHNCITQRYKVQGDYTILTNENPRFYDILHPAGADGLFFTADDGLQLTAPCSPALNSGDNSLAAGTTDILGNPRIYNGATVDIGAYEDQLIPGAPLKVVYVNSAPGIGGANNGSNWQNPFTTLQAALLYCADTIKVAAGTYLTSNSSKDSIFSIENKIVILGGYPSTGSPGDADRNPAIYKTILRGNAQPVTNTASLSPVMEAYGCDSTTLLDGLWFSNMGTSDQGAAWSLFVSLGSSLKISNCRFTLDTTWYGGGGIAMNKNSRPTITNCSFACNYSLSSGTAISSSQSSPVISHCSFNSIANATTYFNYTGSGIMFTSSTGSVDHCTFRSDNTAHGFPYVYVTSSQIQFDSCQFKAWSTGPMLSNTNSGGTVTNCIFSCQQTSTTDAGLVSNTGSNPVFTHCLFDSANIGIGNYSNSTPVFNNCLSVNGKFLLNDNSQPVLNNCTVINTALVDGAGLASNANGSVLTANNTLFWENLPAASVKDISDDASSSSVLHNCLTRNYGTNGVNGNKVGLNPRFIQLTNIYGADKQLGTADDGIQLAPCSPALNAGNNSLATLQTIDIVGNARIYNGTVDIGAYESLQMPNTSNSYYVSAGASSTNGGTSWKDAYSSVQTAVCNVCSDTIRVAAGTYKAAASDRDSSYYIDRPMTFLGGYPSGGGSESSRSPWNNPTILSGDLGVAGDSADNTKVLMNIVGLSDSVLIDGFSFREANNVFSGIKFGGSGGAAIAMYRNKTSIRNCEFIHNSGGLPGGAIGFGGADSCQISNCVFTRNYASNGGGAISTNGSYTRILNCVFDSNYAYSNGGAIALGPTYDVKQCIFYRNYSSHGNGGAIDASEDVGNVTNCVFVQNSATTNGGGYFTNALNGPTYAIGNRITNCIFRGNTVGGSTTALNADADWTYYSISSNSVMQTEQYALATTNKVGANPAFVDSTNPRGPDGRWFTADDGLQLKYNSAAVNLGLNSAIALSQDIAGGQRVVLDTVDAGPYEYQHLPQANAGLDTTFCAGDSIKIGKDADPTFTYSWTSSPVGFSANTPTVAVNPSATTSYFLSVTDGTQTVTDTVLLTPTASIAPSVTITTDSNTVCEGSNVVFRASAVNPGDSATYQWQIDGNNVGTDSTAFVSANLADLSKVSVVMTSSAACALPKKATSNTLAINVLPTVVPSVSITQSPLSVCKGQTVTYKATAVNGGDHPGFMWYRPGTGFITSNIDSMVVDSLLYMDGYQYYVIMTSTAACASPVKDTSNTITLKLYNQAAASISIGASQTINICKGTPISFFAITNNGGDNPSYQWLINGIDQNHDSAVLTSSTLSFGDQVTAKLTSNSACATVDTATSNTIQMQIIPVTTLSVQLSGNTNVVKGEPTTLTATLANGGITSFLEWQDSTLSHGWQDITSGYNIPNTLSYTPTEVGDKVHIIVTGNAVCVTNPTATSNVLTFLLNTDSVATPPIQDSSTRVHMYPNPVTSTLTIDSLQQSDNWQQLNILSINGQQRLLTMNIQNATSVTVEIANLGPGYYLVRLHRKNGPDVYLKVLKL